MRSSSILYIFSILLFLCISVQIVSAEGGYILSTQWGGEKGSGDGQFNFISDIAMDSAGNVYVGDSGNYRIQKFTSNGTFIMKWGSKVITGSERGKFSWIDAIAVDSAGNVYVGDRGGTYPEDSSGREAGGDLGKDWIKKFTSSGTFITKWEQEYNKGRFDYPWGNDLGAYSATDSAGNVYTIDSGNNQIKKFTSSGTLITQWGSEGKGNGQFDMPTAIAVDSAGNVYVAEWGNYRIQKFTSNGTFITKFRVEGDIEGLAVDSVGNIYASNSYSLKSKINYVQKFSPEVTSTPLTASMTTSPTAIQNTTKTWNQYALQMAIGFGIGTVAIVAGLFVAIKRRR